ncbi:hypothetical protein KGQ20_06870 [Catenulispora sp. NF23]|uniref:hypothetical protein n=1 Tax=Catenulispora pinistramenti TaxID=2705254 RepID=UPI001BAA02BE|nr:hypothetical protein [Catenulispora pinistramenti]MBS2532491.1 hypothetical protein [Catenulispora pinistramenti]
MAKTGRSVDLLDVDGRAGRRRRKGRIRGVLGMLLLAGLTTSISGFTVVESFAMVKAQGRQNTYDNAPYCTGSGQTDNCVLRTNANVDYVGVWKNSGRKAHGYTTNVYLDPTVGETQYVTLSSAKDLSGSVSEGDQMAVLVWHDQITRYTFLGKTHDTDLNPHHVVTDDLGVLSMALLVATAFGRPLLRRLLRNRIAINLKRNRVPDWTLVGLGLAAAMSALFHATYVLAVFNVTGVALLVLSVAWPFIPWVATQPLRGEPMLLGQRGAAAAKANAKGKPRRQLP